MHLTEETAKKLLLTQQALLREQEAMRHELEQFNRNSPFILAMLEKSEVQKGRKALLARVREIGGAQLRKRLMPNQNESKEI